MKSGPPLRPARALVAAAVVYALALGGCATTGGEALKANAQVVQRESTPKRLVEKGDAFAAVGDTTRAEQYFAAALSAGGPPTFVTRRLIRVCVADQRYHVAIVYAENHLRRYPDDREVRFVLATLLAGVGDAAAARQHFEQLEQTSPEDADVHFALAVLLREDFRDLAGADRHFREYLRLSPTGADAAQARTGLLKLRSVKR
jgi:tetratricopeptide (TPR) repeat protein